METQSPEIKTVSTDSNTDGVETKTKSRRSLPVAELDILTLAKTVFTQWKKSGLTLTWITPEKFQTYIGTFDGAYTERVNKGAARSSITKKLKELNVQINESLNYVKGYINEKYGKKNAQSYYSQFGIDHYGNSYAFSQDNDRRKQSLDMLIEALSAHDFADKMYGVNYWMPIRDLFASLLEQARDNDTLVSNKVKIKNESKTEVIKTLNALVNLLKANFPDTYKYEMREWGFQKEKY